MALEPAQLNQFRFSAGLIKESILCIEDSPEKPIVFCSKLECLGYKDGEVLGLPFNETFLPAQLRDGEGRIVKDDFHSFHDLLMKGVAQKAKPGEPAAQMVSRSVQILHRDGTLKLCKIQISYVRAISDSHRGIFMAILAFEGEIADEQAEAITGLLAHLVNPVEVMKKARAALWRKIAASGGVIAFFTTAIAQITPLGQQVSVAFKAIGAAWTFQSKNPEPVKTLEVFTPVTSDRREEMIQTIRNELHSVDPNVLAVAYYKVKFIPAYRRITLVFKTDTNAPDGRETFFRAATLGPLAVNKLMEHECLYIKNLGSMLDDPKAPTFDGIACPTFNLVKGERLWTTEVANVAAIAIKKPIKLSGTEERLEGVDYTATTPLVVIPNESQPPFNEIATALWKRLSMNVENITRETLDH